MPPPAGPFPCCKPAFVTGQPVDRPRDDRVGDSLTEIPFFCVRIVEAEEGALGTGLVPVKVRDWIVRLSSPAPEERIDHVDAREARQDDCVFEKLAETHGYSDGVAPTEWL